MLTALDILIFLKSDDELDRTAQRVFGALGTEARQASSDEWGDHYAASGLGFQAALFPNQGDLLDPEFEDYQYGLELVSSFWCVELETVDLEGPLSEYFARQLAFELDVETATEILVETTEEAEVFEIRAFRRNPNYRLDQSPTTPKAFVVETREVEEPFDEEEDDAENEGDEEELPAEMEDGI